MSPEASFPQFMRLPVELQLQILGLHRDNSHRYHHINCINAKRSPFEPICIEISYYCKEPFNYDAKTNATTDKSPDVVYGIYKNDGLTNEKITVRSRFFPGTFGPTFPRTSSSSDKILSGLDLPPTVSSGLSLATPGFMGMMVIGSGVFKSLQLT